MNGYQYVLMVINNYEWLLYNDNGYAVDIKYTRVPHPSLQPPVPCDSNQSHGVGTRSLLGFRRTRVPLLRTGFLKGRSWTQERYQFCTPVTVGYQAFETIGG